MTTQEEQLLQELVGRVNRTQLQDKDPEAARLIQQSLAGNPDALYILAQTVLVQEYALGEAQKQLAGLGGGREQDSQQGSFLEKVDTPLRRSAPPPTPTPSPVAQHASDPISGEGPGLAYPTGGYPIPGAPAGDTSQGGTFLSSATRTAKGVTGASALPEVDSLPRSVGAAASAGVRDALHGGANDLGGDDSSDGVGDDLVDYSANADDSVLSDDVGGD